MSNIVIKVNNLTVSYGHHGISTGAALQGACFTVEAGKTLGIIGESGAGKTTLAAAICGMIGASQAEISGEIHFAGHNLLRLKEREFARIRSRGIGMIFQDPRGSLDPAMPVIKQVMEPLMCFRDMSRKAARQTAAQLLTGVGIDGSLLSTAAYPHQLSGGLCQRVVIAMALACRPRLLIADEPTSALDTTVQSQIIKLLKLLQEQNSFGMIFISHDLALISHIADDLLVMYRGRPVGYGKTANIISDPEHPYTAQLVSAWREAGLEKGHAFAAAAL